MPEQSVVENKLQEQATAKAELSYSYWAAGQNGTSNAECPAPRKLTEQEIQQQQELERQSSQGGRSVWNNASTFEERDVSRWATGVLKSRLCEIQFEKNNCKVKVNEVRSINGDATVWMIRGGKRHGFDYNIEIVWTAVVDGTDVKGFSKIPSATPDDLDEDLLIETQLEFKTDGNQQKESTAIQIVQKNMQSHVINALKDFLTQLKQK